MATETHTAIGLGLAACRRSKRVRFLTVAELVTELHRQSIRRVIGVPLYRRLRRKYARGSWRRYLFANFSLVCRQGAAALGIPVVG